MIGHLLVIWLVVFLVSLHFFLAALLCSTSSAFKSAVKKFRSSLLAMRLITKSISILLVAVACSAYWSLLHHYGSSPLLLKCILTPVCAANAQNVSVKDQRNQHCINSVGKGLEVFDVRYYDKSPPWRFKRKTTELSSNFHVVINQIYSSTDVGPVRWHSAARQQDAANISRHNTANTH